MKRFRKIPSSPKQAVAALACALAMALALPFPACADMAQPGLDWRPGQGMHECMLYGVWTCQTPQGPRTFRFSQGRYVQTVNGQMLDEGVFSLTPDGRFRYRVTGGPYAGQQGENRIAFNAPQILVMSWPEGVSAAFVREPQSSQPRPAPSPPLGQWGQPVPAPAPQSPQGQWGQPAPAPAPQSPQGQWGQPAPVPGATPLEGRWVWAKQGQVSFGFIFQGSRFQGFYNGQVMGTGTFELRGPMLVLHHETGRDAGKTDRFACQVTGNRMLLFVSNDPNDHPIPYVRQ